MNGSVLTLREMQHAGRPDDHREAKCDEAINAADREATDKELNELRAAHRMFRSVLDQLIVGHAAYRAEDRQVRSSEDHRRAD